MAKMTSTCLGSKIIVDLIVITNTHQNYNFSLRTRGKNQNFKGLLWEPKLEPWCWAWVHSLITLRSRRRKHGKGPVTNNRADEHPDVSPRGSSSSDLTHVSRMSFVLP